MFASQEVRTLLTGSLDNLRRQLCDFISPEAQTVLQLLHNGHIPADTDFEKLGKVTDLENRKQGGIYIGDHTPSQADGPNSLDDPDTRIFYIGQATGQNGKKVIGGLYKRVTQEHLVSRKTRISMVV